MARRTARDPSAMLSVRDLHVYYGASHALQGVDLTLTSGVHSVVGRNGMGKTTLCNAIMGLTPARSGSIRIDGQEVTGRRPHEIARLGVGYTPQGRRLWPSLSVDEHLRMCQRQGSSWTVERIYDTFPRLAERRSNGGGQLSGGEQQMLAISRALLQDPRLLILDEPTEGLAPVIVAQVEELLHQLADAGDVAILLVEQNIGVATSVADDVAIMVNGRITAVMNAQELGADRALQQSLLGVGRMDDAAEPARPPQPAAAPPRRTETPAPEPVVVRPQNLSGYVPPTRWSPAHWSADRLSSPDMPVPAVPARTSTDLRPMFQAALDGHVLVAGTFDTKSTELKFLADRLKARGVKVHTVDLSTARKPSSANVPPHHIAAFHPHGPSAVFTDDRGSSVSAMAEAFEAWIEAHPNIAGIISAAGSGGTALVTPAMRALPVGVPKVMISTVASGNVGAYVGPSDIMMMYSVTDVQGINRISRRVLGNGADAMAGMVSSPAQEVGDTDKPAIGLTMFGVTTPAVQALSAALKDDYECLVFHATGVGGQSMEKLVDSGFLAGVIDLTTTEICDLLMGGVFAATEDRLGAFIRKPIPYVGSVGALDMVNFGARDTVPGKYRNRLFVEHNPQVTLMRTTVEENVALGRWIGERLNRMEGPVRFFLPEGGVSALDAPGQPFHDDSARAALYDSLTRTVQETANRRLIRHSGHINDPAFATAVLDSFHEIMPPLGRSRHVAH